ncbi:GABA permease [Aspergillus undulatus]|uniref:GABA permease n=1 Tax=Aspergillus undulatus TaxID=1810928 RepID=UPI003CCD390F
MDNNTAPSFELKNRFHDPLSDEAQLAELGHTQELRREFSLWSVVCLQIALMATWEALSAVAAAALTSGGSPCLFYNYLLSFASTVFIAISLGEIASTYPTAGGQYHWVYYLGSHPYQATAAWFTGWISIGGQLALITLNHYDSYIPTRWQGMLFYWAVVAYSMVVNIWGSRILPHTSTAAGIIHVIGFVVIVIVLGAMSPKQSTASVFTQFSNSSGWGSDGVSWLVGLLSTVYPFLGYDAACHLSEELPNPKRNVPLAMVGSVLINGVIGLGYTIMLLFTIGDLQHLLDSKTGFPFMQLFLDITSSPAGASVLTLFITVTATAANASCTTSVSRTAWAFARDGGLPWSNLCSVVHPTLKVPMRMILMVCLLQMLLGLLYLASSTAFNAVLSMAVFGMYASCLFPISFMLVHRYSNTGRHSGLLGTFALGRVPGAVVNIVSALWLVLAMVFSTFPTLQPVTPDNMNYCVVVTMGWVAIGAVYYYLLGGKKQFQGPLAHLVERP